jgi:hypothetical protein
MWVIERETEIKHSLRSHQNWPLIHQYRFTQISHINTPSTVTGHIPAEEGLAKALKGSDLVVIPAGVPRKPGMTRDDLFKVGNLLHTQEAICICRFPSERRDFRPLDQRWNRARPCYLYGSELS